MVSSGLAFSSGEYSLKEPIGALIFVTEHAPLRPWKQVLLN